MKKLKKCSSCLKDKVIWRNFKGKKYCQQCWSHVKSTTSATKPTKQYLIPKKSSKMAKLDMIYKISREQYLVNHSLCEIHLIGCTTKATEIHHTKGRGLYYLDQTTWKATCRFCHNYITKYSAEAIDLKHSTLRLK